MKRLYVLALVAAVFTLCEVKEILKECPIVSTEWETIHIPHETSFHKFYKCLAGKKFEIPCPANKDPPFLLCYNRELQLCDWPWNVTECMGPTSPPTLPPVTNSQTPTLPPVTNSQTPTLPPVTNSQTPTLPPVTNSQTPTLPPTNRPPSPNPNDCPVNGKHPHPNCKMYYDFDGKPMCCLQNLVFNPALCACDLPGNVRSCKPSAADYEECGH